MSKISKKVRNKMIKGIGDHEQYISRITKTLYYGKLPKTDRLSLPVTELAAELFSESQRGKSLDRLHCNDAANISRNACVSPCSLVLAILYLERLKAYNTEYLEKTSPSDLFLVSLMVSSKFLYDDGETDEVFIDEWARSAGKTNQQLIQLEKDFLKAISWEIFVNELTFWKKLNEVESKLAERQGVSRGFFTYTELQYLLQTIDLHNVIQCFVTVSVVLTASYIAGLLTMIGSVFIVSNIPGSCLQLKKIDNHLNNNVLPIMYEQTQLEADNITFDVVRETEEIKTDNLLLMKKDSPGGLNILKTGLFLASIEGLLKPFCKKTSNVTDSENEFEDSNVQYVTWDWWTIPAMNLLSKASEFVENYKLPRFDLGYFGFFLETVITNSKQIDLEDHIHKSTKTRIQDQMESSWHEEWSDTIKLYFIYTHNIKT